MFGSFVLNRGGVRPVKGVLARPGDRGRHRGRQWARFAWPVVASVQPPTQPCPIFAVTVFVRVVSSVHGRSGGRCVGAQEVIGQRLSQSWRLGCQRSGARAGAWVDDGMPAHVILAGHDAATSEEGHDGDVMQASGFVGQHGLDGRQADKQPGNRAAKRPGEARPACSCADGGYVGILIRPGAPIVCGVSRSVGSLYVEGSGEPGQAGRQDAGK